MTGRVPVPEAIGQALRQEREAQNLSIQDVARKLRLREEVIIAIETSQYHNMPYGPAYIRGFIESYRRIIGLKSCEGLNQLEDFLGPSPHLVMPVPLPSLRKAGFIRYFLPVVGLGLASFFIFFTYHHREVAPVQGPILGKPFPTIEIKDVPTPTESPKEAFSGHAISDSAISKIVLPDFSYKDLARTGDDIAIAEDLPTGTLTVEKESGVQLDQTESLEATKAPDAIVKSKLNLVLKSLDTSWVELRDQGGKVYISRILYPGDSLEIPDSPPLFLTTGNLGGLSFQSEGRNLNVLGKKGQVRRHLPLTFESLQKEAGQFAASNQSQN